MEPYQVVIDEECDIVDKDEPKAEPLVTTNSISKLAIAEIQLKLFRDLLI
jgi:hypothetical protein